MSTEKLWLRAMCGGFFYFETDIKREENPGNNICPKSPLFLFNNVKYFKYICRKDFSAPISCFYSRLMPYRAAFSRTSSGQIDTWTSPMWAFLR